MLTPEELLLDRYKVTNIWPDMDRYGMYQGQIVTLIKQDDGDYGWPCKIVTYYKSWFENFPRLFQPLPWWSDREVSDMPEFVKCIETPDQIIQPGEVIKVIWQNANWGKSDDSVILPYTNCYEPATLADYEAYQQSKNK